MLTRETDYALRVIRSLLDGERKSVGDISKEQMIPQQFAYKIVKKLSVAGLVQITRGVDGGCRLAANPAQVSLYDLMVAMKEHCSLNACMNPDYHCAWKEKNGGCKVHSQLCVIQNRLNEELRSCSLETLLMGQ